MVLVPLASYLAQLAVLAGCGTVLAYIWTDPTHSYEATLSWAEEAARRLNGTAGIHFQVDSAMLSWLPVYESGYVAFCGLWTYFFCETISTTVISGCAVYYYFIDSDTAGHHDERYEDNQTNLVTLTQLRQVCSCNLGTMAFGSLILALVGARGCRSGGGRPRARMRGRAVDPVGAPLHARAGRSRRAEGLR